MRGPRRMLTGLLVATALALLCGCTGSSASRTDGVRLPSLSAFSAAPAPSGSPGSSMAVDVPPNDTDLALAIEMIPHHRQAVQMSDDLLAKDGIDQKVRELAAFIKRDQGLEIDAMTQWLAAWDRTHPELHVYRATSTWITAAAGPHGGMVPDEQASELAGLRGRDAEAQFLILMVLHHQGALAMAKAEVEHGSNAFVLQVSKHILSEQSLEITAMNQLVKAICGDSVQGPCGL